MKPGTKSGRKVSRTFADQDVGVQFRQRLQGQSIVEFVGEDEVKYDVEG